MKFPAESKLVSQSEGGVIVHRVRRAETGAAGNRFRGPNKRRAVVTLRAGAHVTEEPEAQV